MSAPTPVSLDEMIEWQQSRADEHLYRLPTRGRTYARRWARALEMERAILAFLESYMDDGK